MYCELICPGPKTVQKEPLQRCGLPDPDPVVLGWSRKESTLGLAPKSSSTNCHRTFFKYMLGSEAEGSLQEQSQSGLHNRPAKATIAQGEQMDGQTTHSHSHSHTHTRQGGAQGLKVTLSNISISRGGVGTIRTTWGRGQQCCALEKYREL